jgi:hypothetical protein
MENQFPHEADGGSNAAADQSFDSVSTNASRNTTGDENADEDGIQVLTFANLQEHNSIIMNANANAGVDQLQEAGDTYDGLQGIMNERTNGGTNEFSNLLSTNFSTSTYDVLDMEKLPKVAGKTMGIAANSPFPSFYSTSTVYTNANNANNLDHNASYSNLLLQLSPFPSFYNGNNSGNNTLNRPPSFNLGHSNSAIPTPTHVSSRNYSTASTPKGRDSTEKEFTVKEIQVEKVERVEAEDIVTSTINQSIGKGSVVADDVHSKKLPSSVFEEESTQKNDSALSTTSDTNNKKESIHNTTNYQTNSNSSTPTAASVAIIIPFKSVFVGDLSYFCSENELTKYFSKFGTVQTASIRRGLNGVSLMFGFVKFLTEDEADIAAKETNGVEFMGRNMR